VRLRLCAQRRKTLVRVHQGSAGHRLKSAAAHNVLIPERNEKERGSAMHIILKRSFPWFPMVLAAGWIVMVGLAISDLAWFAAASASFGGRPTAASALKAVPAAGTAVKVPVGVAPCTAAAIAPAARIIR